MKRLCVHRWEAVLNEEKTAILFWRCLDCGSTTRNFENGTPILPRSVL